MLRVSKTCFEGHGQRWQHYSQTNIIMILHWHHYECGTPSGTNPRTHTSYHGFRQASAEHSRSCPCRAWTMEATICQIQDLGLHTNNMLGYPTRNASRAATQRTLHYTAIRAIAHLRPDVVLWWHPLWLNDTRDTTQDYIKTLASNHVWPRLESATHRRSWFCVAKTSRATWLHKSSDKICSDELSPRR